jgi:hypothetical protein
VLGDADRRGSLRSSSRHVFLVRGSMVARTSLYQVRNRLHQLVGHRQRRVLMRYGAPGTMTRLEQSGEVARSRCDAAGSDVTAMWLELSP